MVVRPGGRRGADVPAPAAEQRFVSFNPELMDIVFVEK
jgi:hypothetical protein